MQDRSPREGDIHEVVCVGGHCFTIRYGYYSELERGNADPIPIYPCFITEPHYTDDGHPLVTRIQDACEHYCVGDGLDGDGWCADCIHCNITHNEIGICRSVHRRKQMPAAMGD